MSVFAIISQWISFCIASTWMTADGTNIVQHFSMCSIWRASVCNWTSSRIKLSCKIVVDIALNECMFQWILKIFFINSRLAYAIWFDFFCFRMFIPSPPLCSQNAVHTFNRLLIQLVIASSLCCFHFDNVKLFYLFFRFQFVGELTRIWWHSSRLQQRYNGDVMTGVVVLFGRKFTIWTGHVLVHPYTHALTHRHTLLLNESVDMANHAVQIRIENMRWGGCTQLGEFVHTFRLCVCVCECASDVSSIHSFIHFHLFSAALTTHYDPNLSQWQRINVISNESISRAQITSSCTQHTSITSITQPRNHSVVVSATRHVYDYIRMLCCSRQTSSTASKSVSYCVLWPMAAFDDV